MTVVHVFFGRLLSRGLVLTLAFAFCALIITKQPIHGEEWPQFLGKNRNNRSIETGLLATWPKNGPPLVWTKDVGTGYSAPSVLGELLVLHHRIGDQEIVEGINAVSGITQWRYAYASRFVDPYGYNNGPRATPLLSGDRCYTFGAEGKLLCLSLRDGAVVWQRDTAKDWTVPEAFFGVGSTPVLENGKLVVMVGGQPNSGIVALDPKTGKTIWESVGRDNWSGVLTRGWRSERPYVWTGTEKSASYSTPVPATIRGQRHLLSLMRQGLVSVNPTNGTINFSYWFQSPADNSVNAMCPIVSDDRILISAAYYRIGAVLLQVAEDGKSVRELWRLPVQMPNTPAMVRGTPPQPLELHWNTPVMVDGYLYAFSGRDEPDAQFNCVEFATGKLMWSRDEKCPKHPPHRAQFAPYGRGSAIAADGKLYVMGEGGRLGLFQINAHKDEEISSFQVPSLGYPCWTGPVLSRKRLYLRDEQKLACYSVAARDKN